MHFHLHLSREGQACLGYEEYLKVDTTKKSDSIEQAVFEALKPHGFRKYGHTLRRFVSEDISQVVNFQTGQAYRGETHLLYVDVGIRVPECMNHNFAAEELLKKFYHEYECNIRSRLGEVKGEKESCYDLRKPADSLIPDILEQIQEYVLPVFEALNSRDAILEKRRDYLHFDTMNDHLILLEEAMIYGRRGDLGKASELFNRYYNLFASGELAQKDRNAIQNHLAYLRKLAQKLAIHIFDDETTI